MNENKKALFRASALRYYREADERIAVPKLARPNTSRIMWLLIALLAGITTLLWSVKLPLRLNAPVTSFSAPDGSSLQTVISVPVQDAEKISTGMVTTVRLTGNPDFNSTVLDVQTLPNAQLLSGTSEEQRKVLILTLAKPADLALQQHGTNPGIVGQIIISVGAENALTLLTGLSW